MTTGTLEAPQVGKIETPDDTTEETTGDDDLVCHLVHDEQYRDNPRAALCGKMVTSYLNMARTVDRNMYHQLGDGPICTCGHRRCQKCITIYEALKHLSGKGDKQQ